MHYSCSKYSQDCSILWFHRRNWSNFVKSFAPICSLLSRPKGSQNCGFFRPTASKLRCSMRHYRNGRELWEACKVSNMCKCQFRRRNDHMRKGTIFQQNQWAIAKNRSLPQWNPSVCWSCFWTSLRKYSLVLVNTRRSSCRESQVIASVVCEKWMMMIETMGFLWAQHRARRFLACSRSAFVLWHSLLLGKEMTWWCTWTQVSKDVCPPM